MRKQMTTEVLKVTLQIDTSTYTISFRELPRLLRNPFFLTFYYAQQWKQSFRAVNEIVNKEITI